MCSLIDCCLFSTLTTPCFSPESAQSTSFPVKEGDLIMVGTDGLFDNMTEEMLLYNVAKLKVRQYNVNSHRFHMSLAEFFLFCCLKDTVENLIFMVVIMYAFI